MIENNQYIMYKNMNNIFVYISMITFQMMNI